LSKENADAIQAEALKAKRTKASETLENSSHTSKEVQLKMARYITSSMPQKSVVLSLLAVALNCASFLSTPSASAEGLDCNAIRREYREDKASLERELQDEKDDVRRYRSAPGLNDWANDHQVKVDNLEQKLAQLRADYQTDIEACSRPRR